MVDYHNRQINWHKDKIQNYRFRIFYNADEMGFAHKWWQEQIKWHEKEIRFHKRKIIRIKEKP